MAWTIFLNCKAVTAPGLNSRRKDMPREDDIRRAQRACEIYRKITEQNPGEVWPQLLLGGHHRKLGALHQAQGNFSEAMSHYMMALNIHEALGDQYPGKTWYQRQVALSHSNLGAVHQAQGNLPEALNHLMAAQDISQKLAEQNPRYDEAQRLLAESLQRVDSVKYQMASTADDPAVSLAPAP
jgi:tetratricopeptide (TPR) repeat protein